MIYTDPYMMGIFIAFAGGFGAVARALLDEFITNRGRFGWPAGILTVNIIGSFFVGILSATGPQPSLEFVALRMILVAGFLGGFTTFSTAMVDGVKLARTGKWGKACALVLGNYATATLAFLLGAFIAQLIWQ